MINFRAYKEQYRLNITLALPVILSQVGQVVVQLVDNAMVGRIGAVPLAAVSFGGSVFFILFIFGMGITMGLTPLVGESFSKKEHRSSSKYLQNALLLYGLIGLAIFAVLYSLVPLLKFMGQTEQVVALATPYYKYLVWSIIPFMIFSSFKQFLEGVGNTRVVMVIVLTSNLINVFFNYLFIYGSWGCPAMGAAGAGLATMISRLCMPIFVVIYFLKKDAFRRYLTMFKMSHFGLRWMRSLLQVGVPISLQMLMEGSAFALSSIMMGWIGAVEMAANLIAMSVSNFAFMILMGVSAATTIRVSHEFGRGNLKGLNLAATASYHIGLAYNFVTALLFISFRHYIPYIFTSDPAVIEVASKLLIFAAAFQICDGLQIISLGVLRGIKDVNYAMVVAFVSYILINLPMGYVLAFVLEVGPAGLWIGFVFGLSVAAYLLNRRFRKKYVSLRKGVVGVRVG